MSRNIAKPFYITASIIDIQTISPKYRCFFGEDVELFITVLDEYKKPLDLSDVYVKVFYINSTDEFRQDDGITITDPLDGKLRVMVKKGYIQSGNSTVRVILFDNDQEIYLQPFQIQCLDVGIKDAGHIIVDDDLNARDEFVKVRGDISVIENDLGETRNYLYETRNDVDNVKDSIIDINSSLETKTSYSYVNEQIAKAQLEGAGVDTTNFVVQSELLPVKKSIDSNTLNVNIYTSYVSSTIDGTTTVNSLVKGVDYITFDITCSNTQSNNLSFMLPIKTNEVDYVVIEAEMDLTMSRPYVAIGTGFNWGAMKKVDVSKGVLVTTKILGSEVPNYQNSTTARIMVGDNGGSAQIKGKLKFTYFTLGGVKLRAELASSALQANNAMHATNADYATRSVSADSAFDAGILPLNTIKPSHNTISVVKQTNGSYQITKLSGGVIDKTWCCIYIEVPYSKLTDLDKDFILNCNTGTSTLPIASLRILKSYNSDWNPSGYPITLTNNNFNNKFNLYESIVKMGQDFIDYYSAKTSLQVSVVYERPTSGEMNTATIDLNIKPIFNADDAIVAASSMSSVLEQKIQSDNLELVRRNIHTIPIGVRRIRSTDCLIRGNDSTYPAVLSQNGKYVNVKKENDGVGTKYAGIYAEIEYDHIDELDGNITISGKVNEGSALTQACILYEVSDWGNTATAGVINFTLGTTFNLKEKLLASGLNYANKTYLYICVVRYSSSGVSGRYNYDFEIVFTPTKTEDVLATQLSSGLMEELREEFQSISSGGGKYITCWGDSLTAGGGWTTTMGNLLGLAVYNGGTGGENSKTIMARQGGDVMMVNNITIPATTDPITIATRSGDGGITTFFGNKATPLLQGGTHVNPCYIGDIQGTLKWTGSSHSDTTGTWTFTRTQAGTETVVNRPTALRTDFDINKNAPYIMVIFIGQNGGYDSHSHLISQHRLMIEHSNCRDFIVLGLSSGTASARAEYESAMRNEFGRRFISLREYLSVYGLADAGITPTQQDTDMMAQGQTPQSLLSDTVHYNDACKTVIGKMLAKKIKELNMI